MRSLVRHARSRKVAARRPDVERPVQAGRAKVLPVGRVRARGDLGARAALFGFDGDDHFLFAEVLDIPDSEGRAEGTKEDICEKEEEWVTGRRMG